MIVARIESLILGKGMKDAIERARKYVEAGADGIMIHSKKDTPKEIFEFQNPHFQKEFELHILVEIKYSWALQNYEI